MTTVYKTKTAALLRTKAGNQAGETRTGDQITLSSVTRWLHDETWNEISSPNYFELYIRMKDLEVVQTEPPPPPPPPPATGYPFAKVIFEADDGTQYPYVPEA